MIPTTNQKILDLLENFNPKQKQIASRLLIDKNYTFIDNEKILIKNNNTGVAYDFVYLVKSICNCE